MSPLGPNLNPLPPFGHFCAIKKAPEADQNLTKRCPRPAQKRQPNGRAGKCARKKNENGWRLGCLAPSGDGTHWGTAGSGDRQGANSDGALPAKHGALGPNLATCPRLSSFRAVKTGQKPTKTCQNFAPDRRKSAPVGCPRRTGDKERGKKIE